MEVKSGPDSVDEPALLYKLQRKIKVFDTTDPLPNRGYNLVASSSKYGLVFVGMPEGSLGVYYLKQLIDKETDPQYFPVKLPEKPSHVAVSCDYELLAVTGGQVLCIFRVSDFQKQNVAPAISIKCDVNASNFVSALQWNPCVPDSIALAYFDGTLIACSVASGQVKKVSSKARCICWSPKGKQLVTGNSDGTLCQYKPDLTPAKLMPTPNIFDGSPVEALAVYWISTFQFAVVYKNAAENSRPAVTIVNTPKVGPSTCVNYDDICYSMGSSRPWYYYLHGVAQWNIILLSSSNSMELATLGSTDGANWLQWCQTDEGRPELPLTDKKQENYPVGISIDTCAIHQLPWGENERLPHMPLLLVASQTGLLTIFNVINLNKQAPQMCSPPQQITLPAAAMISAPINVAPVQPAPAPVPVAPVKPQVVAQPAPAPPPPQPPQATFSVAPTVSQPTFGAFNTVSAPAPAPAPKPAVEIKPAPPPQEQPQPQPAMPQPKPAAAPPKPQPTPQQAQENAALKAEQERINKMKANQELKSMLIKEVNDFQLELHKFMVKTRETQAKLQRDLENINANYSFSQTDIDQLKKECALDDMRNSIVQLKLELVRACAVVAEARTHYDSKDLHQWTQADPLTVKRVASVKKLAYYVQTQLEQANKALDHKWNEMASKDPQFNKPGHRMVRPLLDSVYQPLVRQQEILGRQRAVLRSLRAALEQCPAPAAPARIIRNTPFRNIKDPLSKLTKNILNMSIEPQNKSKVPLLNASKLDALRDMLSNHKTVKIKPVNVELRHQLAAMKLNYEKSTKEKVTPSPPKEVKTEPLVPKIDSAPVPVLVKSEPKFEQPKPQPISIPSFTPVGNMKPAPPLANVARTLFTDEPKQEPKPLRPPSQSAQPSQPNLPFSFPKTSEPPINEATRSVLKDLLQNKAQGPLMGQAAENKTPAAFTDQAGEKSPTFMGQKICSPTAFAQPSPPGTVSPPSSIFTSKPIADMSNMINKFQSPSFTQETKPKSDETGETETQAKDKPVTNLFEVKPKTDKPSIFEMKPPADKTKEEKPLTNLFAMKTPAPLSTSTPKPHLIKTAQAPKSENQTPVEKTKENVPEKSDEKVALKPAEKKEISVKPLSTLTNNKSSVFESTTQPPPKSSSEEKEVKTDTKVEEPKPVDREDAVKSNASAPSIFAAANAASSASIPSTASKSDVSEPSESKSVSASSSASSIFGAAVAAQPNAQTGSIFSASTPSSIFSSASQSIFGNASSSAQSVFSSASKASVFSTPAATASTTTPSTSTVFGKSFTTPTTTSASIFGSTAASVFGTATTTQSSVFGTGAATTQSVFMGTPTITEAKSTAFSTQPSVFGTTGTTTTTQSIFGAKTETTQADFGSGAFTSTPSIFSATTQPSVFGSTTQASIFGTNTQTTQASVFGSSTQAQPSVFGTPPSTQASVFGTPTQTTQASVFGTPTQTTQASVFGTPTQTTQASVFGTPTQTTQASVFGTPTQTTQASIFGTPTQTSQASVFGTPTPSTQGSVFGTPTQTTQTSVFGTPTQPQSVFGAPPATTSQSLFGGAESNLFASASISTTSAPTQSSGANIFGGGSSTGSIFGGSSSNVFGGKSTFGQSNNTAASIFGGAAAFGQKPATNFWPSGDSGNTTSGFGSGFGQQATTQASSIFGGGTGGSFSSPSPGGAFGTQPASAFGAGEAKPSAFGTPQQQAAPGFGGSPVFGNKPVFGQTSSFGSPNSPGTGFGAAATFGGGFNKSPGGGWFGAPATFGGAAGFAAPTFGGSSPGKVFGGSSPGGFGTTNQSNATFENLATQNTLTFGNIAQQSGQPQQQAPTFNTSPSFTGWRG